MLNRLQMLRDAGFIEVIAEDRTDQVGIHLHFFFSIYEYAMHGIMCFSIWNNGFVVHSSYKFYTGS